jgi:hypothetical protein
LTIHEQERSSSPFKEATIMNEQSHGAGLEMRAGPDAMPVGIITRLPRRRSVHVAAASLAATGIAAGLFLSLASSAGASGQGARNLQYVGKVTSGETVGLGSTGVVPGTEFLVAGELLRSGKQAGSFILNCTADTPGTTAELACSGTAWIGSGWDQISFAGYKANGSPGSAYAIVGGTGIYEGTHGQLMTAKTSAKGESNLTFELEA